MTQTHQAADGREAIPGGTFLDSISHLFPIVRVLLARGHPIINLEMEMGFMPQQDCWRCPLTGVITPADWAAINERFALPRSITYHPGAWGGGGTITDNANYVDIIGARDPNEPGNDADLFAVIRPYDPREDAARG